MSLLRKIARNVVQAIRLVGKGQIGDLVFQLRNQLRGVDLEFESVESLGLSVDSAHFHSHSGGSACRSVFRRLPIPPGSVALDLGSGKGGAIISLRSLPFDEVIGVEISERLIEIARANVERLGLRGVRFVHSDASRYTDFDTVTHVYLYNPFPCAVMADVLANLAASVRRVDRPLHLVYRNPLCSEMVQRSGLFDGRQEVKPDHHTWHLFSRHNKPARAGDQFLHAHESPSVRRQ